MYQIAIGLQPASRVAIRAPASGLPTRRSEIWPDPVPNFDACVVHVVPRVPDDDVRVDH